MREVHFRGLFHRSNHIGPGKRFRSENTVNPHTIALCLAKENAQNLDFPMTTIIGVSLSGFEAA